MRLHNYLNEIAVIEDPEKVLKVIKRDCKSFLKESKGHLLYRGSKKDFAGLIAALIPRKERRPLLTAKPWHNWGDSYFLKKFGWKARSEGVFTVGSVGQAAFYGSVHMFFPIGDYKYIWSPRVGDFTTTIANYPFEVFQEEPEINKRIMSLMDSYIDKGLHRAITEYPMWEILFKCKKFYLVKLEARSEIIERL